MSPSSTVGVLMITSSAGAVAGAGEGAGSSVSDKVDRTTTLQISSSFHPGGSALLNMVVFLRLLNFNIYASLVK